MYSAYIQESGNSKSLVILYNGGLAAEFCLPTCDTASCQVNGNRISLITSFQGWREGLIYVMKEGACVEVQPMAIC